MSRYVNMDGCKDAYEMMDRCIAGQSLRRQAEKMAGLVATDLFFMGSVASLIPHLKDAHGLSKDQIKLGVDYLIDDGGDPLRVVFDGWEKYY